MVTIGKWEKINNRYLDLADARREEYNGKKSWGMFCET